MIYLKKSMNYCLKLSKEFYAENLRKLMFLLIIFFTKLKKRKKYTLFWQIRIIKIWRNIELRMTISNWIRICFVYQFWFSEIRMCLRFIKSRQLTKVKKKKICNI
ncbi:hypothetical protein EDEG_03355 [Edhazardia aedis USNM 41457]|uniref:Uncharacterized protein n=1 Tax=Edhazardia aedis (strain USNM 41457) TaxID=1003232 RepID=J9D308_EDHAE|nr:hypothetical protein EDEG_03355 [Edhazardia aedis USNM 41457]|eukprot:EJW02201.1 hypothetical protein EDEG_03355 [Edhazardia aedis USNM 41457]